MKIQAYLTAAAINLKRLAAMGFWRLLALKMALRGLMAPKSANLAERVKVGIQLTVAA